MFVIKLMLFRSLCKCRSYADPDALCSFVLVSFYLYKHLGDSQFFAVSFVKSQWTVDAWMRFSLDSFPLLGNGFNIISFKR